MAKAAESGRAAVAVPVTPLATVRAPHLASGTPLAAPTPADALPPASTVLDRWKDSGKPL